jgi:uncharacterized membrane protein
MTTKLASALTQKQRLASIDLLRGIVMIFLILPREFFMLVNNYKSKHAHW